MPKTADRSAAGVMTLKIDHPRLDQAQRFKEGDCQSRPIASERRSKHNTAATFPAQQPSQPSLKARPRHRSNR